MSRFISMTPLASCLLGCALLGAIAICRPGMGEDTFPRPEIELESPIAGQRWNNGATVAILGRVNPPLQTPVRIEIHSVNDDGTTVRMNGVHISSRTDGVFAASLQPPATGWNPGPAEVRVRLEKMDHLSDTADMTFVGEPRRVQPEREPESSGVVIDLSDPAVRSAQVPRGKTFLVRGRFLAAQPLVEEYGPALYSEYFMRSPAAPEKSVMLDTGNHLTLVDGDHWCYELQLLAPMQLGPTYLSLTARESDVLGPHQLKFIENFPIELTVNAPPPRAADGKNQP